MYYGRVRKPEDQLPGLISAYVQVAGRGVGAGLESGPGGCVRRTRCQPGEPGRSGSRLLEGEGWHGRGEWRDRCAVCAVKVRGKQGRKRLRNAGEKAGGRRRLTRSGVGANLGMLTGGRSLFAAGAGRRSVGVCRFWNRARDP